MVDAGAGADDAGDVGEGWVAAGVAVDCCGDPEQAVAASSRASGARDVSIGDSPGVLDTYCRRRGVVPRLYRVLLHGTAGVGRSKPPASLSKRTTTRRTIAHHSPLASPLQSDYIAAILYIIG
jgi:hypothetical protein